MRLASLKRKAPGGEPDDPAADGEEACLALAIRALLLPPPEHLDCLIDLAVEAGVFTGMQAHALMQALQVRLPARPLRPLSP